MTGHFIAFEGGEGSGKSTQARRLADRLGGRALFTYEPGDTRLGAELRRLVLDSPDMEITDRAEALLMAADYSPCWYRARVRSAPHQTGSNATAVKRPCTSPAFPARHNRATSPATISHSLPSGSAMRASVMEGAGSPLGCECQ